MKQLFLWCALALLMQGCLVTAQTVTVNQEGEIALFSPQSKPNVAYVERVHIELTGSIFASRQRLKNRLIEEAASHDCDAVIDVIFRTRFIWPQAQGIGVAYADD